jgi:hypothetical protein
MVLLLGSVICAAACLLVPARQWAVGRRDTSRDATRDSRRDDADGVREVRTTPRPSLPLSTNEVPRPAAVDVDVDRPTVDLAWNTVAAAVRPTAAAIVRNRRNASASSRFTRHGADGPGGRPAPAQSTGRPVSPRRAGVAI